MIRPAKNLTVEQLVAETLNRWAWATDPYAVEIKRRLDALAEAEKQRDINADLVHSDAEKFNRLLRKVEAERDTLRELLDISKQVAAYNWGTSVSEMYHYERIAAMVAFRVTVERITAALPKEGQ